MDWLGDQDSNLDKQIQSQGQGDAASGAQLRDKGLAARRVAWNRPESRRLGHTLGTPALCQGCFRGARLGTSRSGIRIASNLRFEKTSFHPNVSNILWRKGLAWRAVCSGYLVAELLRGRGVTIW